MKIRIITLLIGLCLTTTAFAEEKFKVCADPENPPYSTQKQDGFENKIAQLFAKELGQELEYTWFPQRIGFIRSTLTAQVNEDDASSKEFKCDVVMGVPAGYDMTLTTTPYYQSTYVLLIAKGRGWDDINKPEQLATLKPQRQQALKIAMFDRGPGTTWLQKADLLDNGIPYQSMSGDAEQNVAMQINDDLQAKKIDMVILWGPMAAYILSQNPKDSYTLLNMPENAGIKFSFPMAMGVRKGDTERRDKLNELIAAKAGEIQAILASYSIPLLAITTDEKKDK